MLQTDHKFCYKVSDCFLFGDELGKGRQPPLLSDECQRKRVEPGKCALAAAVATGTGSSSSISSCCTQSGAAGHWHREGGDGVNFLLLLAWAQVVSQVFTTLPPCFCCKPLLHSPKKKISMYVNICYMWCIFIYIYVLVPHTE